MDVKTVRVGKLGEKYFKDGIAEYIGRIGRFAKVKIVWVPDEKAPEKLSPAKMEQVKEIEGKRILDKIRDKEYVYITTTKGKEETSKDFAKEPINLITCGYPDIIFMIGESSGTNDTVNKRAGDLISFGGSTVSYQLIRLVLAEQIYRAFIISSDSPCHK